MIFLPLISCFVLKSRLKLDEIPFEFFCVWWNHKKVLGIELVEWKRAGQDAKVERWFIVFDGSEKHVGHEICHEVAELFMTGEILADVFVSFDEF